MREKDVERIKILQQLNNNQITQTQASISLGISKRHVRNLLKSYKNFGNEGVISKQLGKPSNHQLSQEVKDNIINIIKTNYQGF